MMKNTVSLYAVAGIAIFLQGCKNKDKPEEGANVDTPTIVDNNETVTPVKPIVDPVETREVEPENDKSVPTDFGISEDKLAEFDQYLAGKNLETTDTQANPESGRIGSIVAGKYSTKPKQRARPRQEGRAISVGSAFETSPPSTLEEARQQFQLMGEQIPKSEDVDASEEPPQFDYAFPDPSLFQDDDRLTTRQLHEIRSAARQFQDERSRKDESRRNLAKAKDLEIQRNAQEHGPFFEMLMDELKQGASVYIVMDKAAIDGLNEDVKYEIYKQGGKIFGDRLLANGSTTVEGEYGDITISKDAMVKVKDVDELVSLKHFRWVHPTEMPKKE